MHMQDFFFSFYYSPFFIFSSLFPQCLVYILFSKVSFFHFHIFILHSAKLIFHLLPSNLWIFIFAFFETSFCYMVFESVENLLL